MIEEKTFNSDIRNITLYIDKKINDSKFEGIFLNDASNKHRTISIFAQSGELKQNNGVPNLVLYNGVQYEKAADGSKSHLTFDVYNFSLGLKNTIKSLHTVDRGELSTYELLFNSHEGKKHKEFIVSGVRRIIWPLNNIIIGVVALSIVMNAKFHRKHKVTPSVIAFVLSSAYLICSTMLFGAASNNLAILYLQAILIMLILIVSLAYFYQWNIIYKLLYIWKCITEIIASHIMVKR